jgi:hypothetical protein
MNPLNPPPQLTMTHRYEVRRTDLFIAHLLAMFYNKIIVGMLVVLMLFAAYGLGMSNEAKEYSIGVRIFTSLFAMLSVLILWVILQLILAALMVFGRKNQGIVCWHTLTITDEGLTEKTDYNQTLQRWNGFHRIRDTFGYYYIFVTEALFHLVPKKSFNSPKDAQCFMDEIRRRAGIK